MSYDVLPYNPSRGLVQSIKIYDNGAKNKTLSTDYFQCSLMGFQVPNFGHAVIHVSPCLLFDDAIEKRVKPIVENTLGVFNDLPLNITVISGFAPLHTALIEVIYKLNQGQPINEADVKQFPGKKNFLVDDVSIAGYDIDGNLINLNYQ